MKKIMITGGAGFIGSNLIQRLLNEDHIVYCVDNLSTGRIDNIEKFLNHPNFYFCKTDILEGDLRLAVASANGPRAKYLGDVAFDQIYHLASPASPPKYQENPVKTFRVNTEGTHKMLEFARRINSKVLFASTSEIYGDPLVHPQPETYRGNVSTTGPRANYDESKRGGETLCCDHFRMYGTKTLIARIFNSFGPNMDPNDGRVVSNMICQAIKGENLTVYGDGSQTRSFTYISDLVDGLMKLMESNLFSYPINLGNTHEFTIKELAEIIISQYKWEKDLKIEYKPLPIDDPTQRKPDITLAQRLLGWEPKIELASGLDKTIKYFKEELSKK